MEDNYALYTTEELARTLAHVVDKPVYELGVLTSTQLKLGRTGIITLLEALVGMAVAIKSQDLDTTPTVG